jgi:ribosomal protein S18 acetylase RimI-like enzyme
VAAGVTIRRLPFAGESDIAALVGVLLDCVAGGASVSFMSPLTRERATLFWRRVAAEATAGDRVLLVAEDEHGICGTVQLVLDLPENQPHRADVSKMLVHRRARCRGVGEALMRAAEDCAREHGRTTLVLDTASDDARRLYERLGWIKVGDIPAYALLPDGTPCATTYYFRELSPG